MTVPVTGRMTPCVTVTGCQNEAMTNEDENPILSIIFRHNGRGLKDKTNAYRMV
jgi:hypothetical protein